MIIDMLTNKNKSLCTLTAISIALFSTQYILQLSHQSLFIIKNYLLQGAILLSLQVFYNCLKRELPIHQHVISRIHIVTTIAISLLFISIYPLAFPIKELAGVAGGLILLGFMIRHKEFDLETLTPLPSRKLTWIIVGGSILIGVFVRLYRLHDLPIMVDELNHLLQAKGILAGEPITYIRSLIPITLPVTLIVKYLPDPIFWSRVYCVLLNMVAILPLYHLMKRIHPWAALISIFLFATSPWLVFRSQMIREYAYLPALIYTLLLALLHLFEILKAVSIDPRNIKRAILKGKAYIIIFLVISFYILVVDRQSILLSTLGLFGLFIGISILLLLASPNFRRHWWLALIVIAVVSLAGFFIVKMTAPALIGKVFSPDLYFRFQFVKYFLNNSLSQWYFKSPIIFWPAIIVLSILSLFRSKSRIDIVFLLSAFILYCVLFAILLPEYSKPRYATFAEILFLPLYAMGILSCILLIFMAINRKSFLVAAIITLAISTNYPGIYSHLLKDLWNLGPKQIMNGYVHPVTEEDLYGFYMIDQYFTGKSTRETILFSSFYGNYVQYNGEPVFKDTIFVHYYDPELLARLTDMITSNDQGFYVVDDNRLINPKITMQTSDYCVQGNTMTVQAELSQCDNTLKYDGRYGRFFVWYWDVRSNESK